MYSQHLPLARRGAHHRLVTSLTIVSDALYFFGDFEHDQRNRKNA